MFRLSEPFAPFLNAWVPANLTMVPKHIYEGTDFRNNPANAEPIGTGPYKFAEWRRGEFIRLERFEDYWQESLPAIDEIYFHILPDASARAVALETGQVDFAGPDTVELFDIPRLLELDHLEGTQKGSEFQSPMTWIEINHRNPPLDDKRFRQAMMHAIDREFIRDNIWGGYGVVPNGPIASTTRFHDSGIQPYPHDPDRARALLDEMGLEPDADGVRASVSLLPLPYGETWRRLAEYIRQSLGEVGIEVTIESVDPAGWVQRVSNWDYDLTVNRLSQFGDPAIGVGRTYVSSNIVKGVMFNNTMGYENPRVDELFEQAAAATSEEERQRLYSEVQKILVEDVPVVWLLEIKTPTIYNNRFENVIVDALGERSTLANIRLAE